MTDGIRQLAEWIAVLVFVFGALGAFIRIRDFYYRRGWKPDPLKAPADDELMTRIPPRWGK